MRNRFKGRHRKALRSSAGNRHAVRRLYRKGWRSNSVRRYR